MRELSLNVMDIVQNSISAGASLITIEVKESLPEDLALDTALEALARSLCSLESVGEACFLVDGEFASRYGSTDISEPYVYGEALERS